MSPLSNDFCKKLGIEHPIFCGAMYPCSNPELVAAVSQAGGLGVIQPISLSYVHGYQLRAGIQKVKNLTQRPVAFNALIEASSKTYLERMNKWVDIALEEGIRIFITALGKPDQIVKKVHAKGGMVLHDVTEHKWALVARDAGVDGLICVNNQAGGHLGSKGAGELFEELKALGLPLICAGGVSTRDGLKQALDLGYSAVQMGTAFIATTECNAHSDYKEAIVKAHAKDIVATEKISGVPVSVINTSEVRSLGLKASGLEKWLLKNPKTKHYIRLFYSLKSLWSLKRSNLKGKNYKNFFQAGKSVEGVKSIKSVSELIAELTQPQEL
ncbi:nitronate monooxygenase [bacterium]|nr:nitronate monooxygenase [bacterium]